MAFNDKRKSQLSPEAVTAEGQKAFKLNAEHELYTMVATSMLSGDKYYEKGSAQLDRAEKLVAACNPQFVSNLASYARNELNMRSMPILLSVLLSQKHRGSPLSRKTVFRVLKRADEFGEILGCYANLYGKAKKGSKGAHSLEKKLAGRPNSLVRGLRDVFESGRFNAYHYSKYSNDKKQFTIRDAMFLTHPRAKTPQQKEDFEKIANKKLAVAERWETALSGLGKADENTKLQTWVDLLERGKLGHMALLRNLRNILECNPEPAVFGMFCDELVKGVVKGKQFPFRYWSAYKQTKDILPMKYGRTLQKAINECLVTATRNSYTCFDEGQTLFAIDVSGSMEAKIYDRSELCYREIGLVLGCSAAETNQASYGVFGDGWLFCQPSGNPITSIDACMRANGRVGNGTCPESMVQWLIQQRATPSNVVVFTDMQFNQMQAFRTWWTKFKQGSPFTRLYFVDLSGYGNTPVLIDESTRTYLVAGWNDQVFNVIRAVQQGSSAVEMIRKYEG